METKLLKVPSDSPMVPELQSAYRESTAVAIVLDTGEAFVVTPEKDFEALHRLFNNPSFVESLERSLEDFKNGRVEVFEDDDSP